MSQYYQKLIELLRADHPDLSSWTIICASERAVDPIQHFIHSTMGGILPKVESIDSYITGKISAKLKLYPVAGDEELLLFIQFIAEKYPEELYPARRAATLLPLIIKLAEYNLSRKTIVGTERFTEEEWKRFEEYLAVTQDFRKWLARKQLVLPALEISMLDKITPAGKDIFIGLPTLTPPVESFYKKIGKDRLFIEPPLFGKELSPIEKLPFDSAKNLVLSLSGEVTYAEETNIELISLTGLHALVDLITLETSDFIKQRKDNDQLIIYLLDESLTPLLWRRALRLFGNAVNLAVWLPFSTTAAAKRLMNAIEEAENSGRAPDFQIFATACAMELSRKRDSYIREECEAFEAAISFSTLLDEWKERLGKNLADTAKILINAKKFRVTGSRAAPIQVVGFGHVSGEKFSRGLIISLDSGIMPSQPFEGPFINPVHVPQLRKSVFEYEDLVFRQILASGEKVKIVAVDDIIRERTPSYYLSLLSQEFGRPITKTIFRDSFKIIKTAEKPSVKIDDALRNKLKDFTYSYSSLEKILACPFLFYHQYILGVEPPAFMDDEEKIKMRMGEFVHKFLYKLSTDKDKFADWEKLFDRMWTSRENIETRNIGGIDIYMLNAKIFLREIYDDEKESGNFLIFADNALACEQRFAGTIAGSYKIKGFADRLARLGDKIEVIDFKYAKKQKKYDISQKTSVLKRFEEKCVLHPVAQLVIYQHYNEAQGARFYFLKEPTKDREMALPEKEITQANDLMRAIKERLDEIIGGDKLWPAYESDACEYCRFQALCGREDYYKTTLRGI